MDTRKPTIDAIAKIDQYVENANRDAAIHPMGLSKAFVTKNSILMKPKL